MPASRFEHFSLEYGDTSLPELKSAAANRKGPLQEIRAHEPAGAIAVEYRDLQDIEYCQGEEFYGEKLSDAQYGVSFRANVCVRASAGSLLLPKIASDNALTRVTYWHLSENDFFSLGFLRNLADQQLFIAGLSDAALLLRLSRLNTVHILCAAAYSRAIALITANASLTAEEAEEFCALMAGHWRSGNLSLAQRVTGDFRYADHSGEAGLILACLLREHGRAAREITVVLEESVARLIRVKPKHYSHRLSEILDFVLAEKFTAPSSAHLLWQTYLAAAAERALALLRRTFVRAKMLKADRDTLEMIYKTWRGFVNSESALQKPKKIRPPKWLNAPNRAELP